MLILRMLKLGPNHGQGIARAIEQQSENVLLVDHGALYPARDRLENKGWINAGWGVSSNNRKARFYKLTPKGRKHLLEGAGRWHKVAGAISRLLGPLKAEG